MSKFLKVTGTFDGEEFAEIDYLMINKEALLSVYVSNTDEDHQYWAILLESSDDEVYYQGPYEKGDFLIAWDKLLKELNG